MPRFSLLFLYCGGEGGERDGGLGLALQPRQFSGWTMAVPGTCCHLIDRAPHLRRGPAYPRKAQTPGSSSLLSQGQCLGLCHILCRFLCSLQATHLDTSPGTSFLKGRVMGWEGSFLFLKSLPDLLMFLQCSLWAKHLLCLLKGLVFKAQSCKNTCSLPCRPQTLTPLLN